MTFFVKDELEVGSVLIERADLFYKEGTSDKVYHATLEKSGGGYVVNYAYGRRGSALKTGTKTSSPLSQLKAREVFEKLVSSKTIKGYQYMSINGNPSKIPTVTQIKQPVHQCNLLNPIYGLLDASVLIQDDEWVMQPKIDGVRFLLSISSNSVIESFNRKGIGVSCPTEISDSVRSAHLYYEGGIGSFLIDGELVGEVYHVFDILEREDKDLRNLPLHQRLTCLNQLTDDLECDNIVRVSTYFSKNEKESAFKLLSNTEGVVFKHKNAEYTPGRPASGGSYLKYKFVETGSFIVNGINQKRSVELKLVTGDVIGNVTIPVNFEVPKVGDVVEVRYLYAYKNGSLYQPVYLGVRSDIDESECTKDQLKYKS